MSNIRITILGLVFVLSTVFFWMAINEYVLTSKAQLASNVQIVPHAKSIECNPAGECRIHILGSTATTNALAGVTGHVTYGPNLLPDRIDYTGLCKNSSYGLEAPLQFDDDSASKTLTFTVGALKDDAELKGGNGCIATLVFKPTQIQNDPQDTTLALSTSKPWKVGGLIDGQKAVFSPQVEQQSIAVKIDSSVQWPDPDDAGGPVPSGGPNRCVAKNGDCNCNQFVDMIDWEIIRAARYEEGGSCDMNGDGVVNAIEMSLWRTNLDLLK